MTAGCSVAMHVLSLSTPPQSEWTRVRPEEVGGATEHHIIDACPHVGLLGELNREDEVFKDGFGDVHHVVMGCTHLEVPQSVEEEACMGDGVGYSFEPADEGKEVVV